MTTAEWVADAESVGLKVAADMNDLAHVVIDQFGTRNCDFRGEPAVWPAALAKRVCMFCRELPGRERHYKAVVSGVAPHPCQATGCDLTVTYDDEPFCFKHSPDEGSSVPGFSARALGLVAKEVQA